MATWSMNLLEFETTDKLIEFIQSPQFVEYADRLKPFFLDIQYKENGMAVRGRLESRTPTWYDETKLTDGDWQTTYQVPHTQAERDPLPEQRVALAELDQIEALINNRLNEE